MLFRSSSDDAALVQLINTLCLPQKLARELSRPGMGTTAILATKITWCGETTHVGVDVNNTHLSMNSPLIHAVN